MGDQPMNVPPSRISRSPFKSWIVLFLQIDVSSSLPFHLVILIILTYSSSSYTGAPLFSVHMVAFGQLK